MANQLTYFNVYYVYTISLSLVCPSQMHGRARKYSNKNCSLQGARESVAKSGETILTSAGYPRRNPSPPKLQSQKRRRRIADVEGAIATTQSEKTGDSDW